MEKMYEVLRFQEYKDQCRQSADCLEGCLLIYYLQEHECIGKGQLFSWFRQLWKSLCYMYSQKDAGLYGYSMAIGVVIFLFSFALSACVNKVTNRDTLEF